MPDILTPEQQKLVSNNMGLVTFVLTKLRPDSNDWADCRSMGYMALMRAAQLYNPALGYSFSSYAISNIYGYIIRYLRNNQSSVYIPMHIYDNLTKLKQEMLTHNITLRQACDKLNVSYDDVGLAFNAVHNGYSHASINSDDDNPYADMQQHQFDILGYVEPDFEVIENNDMFDACFTYINQLPGFSERSKNIVRDYLTSLKYDQLVTLQDLGIRYGVSRQHCSHTVKRILSLLYTNVIKQGYDDTHIREE